MTKLTSKQINTARNLGMAIGYLIVLGLSWLLWHLGIWFTFKYAGWMGWV